MNCTKVCIKLSWNNYKNIYLKETEKLNNVSYSSRNKKVISFTLGKNIPIRNILQNLK